MNFNLFQLDTYLQSYSKRLTNRHPNSEPNQCKDRQVQNEIDVDSDSDSRHEGQARSRIHEGVPENNTIRRNQTQATETDVSTECMVQLLQF